MLFSNIAALVRRGVKIHFSVEAAGEDRLEVLVSPSLGDATSNKTGVALVARSFQGTPAEFDAEFPAILASFATATLGLQAQMEAASQLMAQAGKSARAAALQAAAKPSLAKPAARPIKTPTSAKPQLLGAEDGDSEDEEDEADDHQAASDGQDGTVVGSATAQSDTARLELTL